MANTDVMTIEGSKTKAIMLILGSAIFVAMGIFLVYDGQMFGWLCAGFFGLGIPVGILELKKNTYITLDPEGFEVNTATRPWRMRWEDVNGFYVGKIYGNKIIAVDFSESYESGKMARKVVAGISGMEGAIPNSFKLKSDEIVEIMNQWKQRHASGMT